MGPGSEQLGLGEGDEFIPTGMGMTGQQKGPFGSETDETEGAPVSEEERQALIDYFMNLYQQRSLHEF